MGQVSTVAGAGPGAEHLLSENDGDEPGRPTPPPPKSASESFVDYCYQSKFQFLNPVCLVGMPLLGLGTLLGEAAKGVGNTGERARAGVSTRNPVRVVPNEEQ